MLTLRPSNIHSALTLGMPSATDPSTLTIEELLTAETRMKSRRLVSGVIIGVLVGIAVWSATHTGGVLTFALLGGAILVARRSAQPLERVRAEIGRREAIPAATPPTSEVA
jgi:F0F1-type ATP synthase assembly protein I